MLIVLWTWSSYTILVNHSVSVRFRLTYKRNWNGNQISSYLCYNASGWMVAGCWLLDLDTKEGLWNWYVSCFALMPSALCFELTCLRSYLSSGHCLFYLCRYQFVWWSGGSWGCWRASGGAGGECRICESNLSKQVCRKTSVIKHESEALWIFHSLGHLCSWPELWAPSVE